MKTILFFSILFTLSAQAQKTGVYKIGNTVIQRTDSTQIEYHPRGTDTLKVNWVADNVYILSGKGPSLTVVITKTTGTGYTGHVTDGNRVKKFQAIRHTGHFFPH